MQPNKICVRDVVVGGLSQLLFFYFLIEGGKGGREFGRPERKLLKISNTQELRRKVWGCQNNMVSEIGEGPLDIENRLQGKQKQSCFVLFGYCL